MNIYSFNQLCLNERAEFTWHNAVFLRSVTEGNKRFNLYDAKRFYVRIEYNNKLNTVTEVNAFKSDEPLYKFINDIDIIKLFE